MKTNHEKCFKFVGRDSTDIDPLIGSGLMVGFDFSRNKIDPRNIEPTYYMKHRSEGGWSTNKFRAGTSEISRTSCIGFANRETEIIYADLDGRYR